MGQGQSTQLAQIKYSWIVRLSESPLTYASHASLESFEHAGNKVLAVAYHAATDASHEGARSQHLRFALSRDGGESWAPSTVVAFGGMPVWNPVLFFDKETSRLFLFYSESRKSFSPGGDVKFVTSSNAGQTWSPPTTIYAHEVDGEVPKVTANRPVKASDGSWYLPVHSEPADAYRTFNAKTFHPLKEAGSELPRVSVPAAAAAQGSATCATLLVSADKGLTWKKAGGEVTDAKTWLIDPAVEEGSKKQLILLFRTATGRVYISSSSDRGASWSRPTYTSLPNPNSRVATLTIDGQILVVYNSSASTRAPLSLALSVDDGRSWEPLATLEEDPKGNFSSPSIAEWSEDTVQVAYSVWGEGLKLATVKLATVDG